MKLPVKRRRVAVLCVVAVVLALIAAGGTRAASTAAPPSASASRGFPYCSWWFETTPVSANVALPDTSAAYWTTPFISEPGMKITVKGQFPDARFMSLSVYNNTGGTFTRNGVKSSLTDFQIEPDRGTVNPYQHHTRQAGTFTLSIQRFVSPHQRNVLPLVPPKDQRTTGRYLPANVGFITYRIYLPLTGFRRVPLPTLVFSRHGGTSTLPTCFFRNGIAPLRRNALVRKILQALRSGSVGGQPAALPAAADPPSTPAFQRPSSAMTNSLFPNDANAYLAAVFAPTPGTVTVVQGKAATFTPGSIALPWPDQKYDLRYWSLCNNVYEKPFPVVVIKDPQTHHNVYGCSADLDTPLVGGHYTYVLSALGDRPATATPQNGMVWLPYSQPTGNSPLLDDVVVFRNMLGDDFPNSVQRVQPGSSPSAAQTAMGPYYPRIAQCSVSTFAAGGPSACLAATQ